jgi:predicted permease
VSLVSIFATAIAPIIAVAGVGFLLGSVRTIDADPLNTVTVYVLIPALVFHSLATTDLAGAVVLKVLAGVVVFLVAMVGIAEAVGRALGESASVHGALVLASAFTNSGNYGIPLSEFAFGAVGRATAVLYLVGQSVVMYTLGVYVAARSGGAGGRGAITDVFGLPMVYGVALAVLARWLGVVPPVDGTLMETVRLVGDASIPLMLLLVGIQLADTDYGSAATRVAPATVLKLGVAPVVGLGVVLALGLDDPTVARTFVLECTTPTAITSLILVIELGGAEDGGITAPEYVSTAVLVTTLASVPVLTVLIAVLESGVLV